MLRKTIFASLLASSALSLAVASPATAGETDRAREAIAAAEAKIHTAETLGAPVSAPRDMAEAHAALATAREDFDTHRRDEAIRVAIHAQAMADTAIGIAQQHRNAEVAAARDAQRASEAAARNEAEAARSQAAQAQAEAQGQVSAARQQAADADARAESAEQAAAASAADAAAAREAAAVAAAQPPPPAPQVETTVTTRHATAHRHAARTVRRTTTTHSVAPATSSDEITTTTKVSPQ